jgi:uncharacterized protein with FMN-binding domain
MTADRRPSRIPVRGSLALTLTLGGLALLLGFRSPQGPGTELVVAMGTGEDPGAAPEAQLPAAGRSAPPTREPSVAAGPHASASPSPIPDPTSSPIADPTAATLTATGGAFQFRFGVVQVAVTLEGDQIVDVQALQLPDGDRRSASISQEVEPMLRESALAVDSADIDVVSGATYTSLAYAYSLQSALDQLAAG